VTPRTHCLISLLLTWPLLLSGPALMPARAATAPDPLAALKSGQPRDVAALMDRLAYCAHFGGEEGYDAARRAELNRAMRKWRCATLDRDEQRLRAVHRDNAQVLTRLQQVKDGDW